MLCKEHFCNHTHREQLKVKQSLVSLQCIDFEAFHLPHRRDGVVQDQSHHLVSAPLHKAKVLCAMVQVQMPLITHEQTILRLSSTVNHVLNSLKASLLVLRTASLSMSGQTSLTTLPLYHWAGRFVVLTTY